MLYLPWHKIGNATLLKLYDQIATQWGKYEIAFLNYSHNTIKPHRFQIIKIHDPINVMLQVHQRNSH